MTDAALLINRRFSVKHIPSRASSSLQILQQGPMLIAVPENCNGCANCNNDYYQD